MATSVCRYTQFIPVFVLSRIASRFMRSGKKYRWAKSLSVRRWGLWKMCEHPDDDIPNGCERCQREDKRNIRRWEERTYPWRKNEMH